MSYNKQQRLPLCAQKFWDGLEEREADPKSVQRALAHFALNHSINDSSRLINFKLFEYRNHYNN